MSTRNAGGTVVYVIPKSGKSVNSASPWNHFICGGRHQEPDKFCSNFHKTRYAWNKCSIGLDPARRFLILDVSQTSDAHSIPWQPPSGNGNEILKLARASLKQNMNRCGIIIEINKTGAQVYKILRKIMPVCKIFQLKRCFAVSGTSTVAVCT